MQEYFSNGTCWACMSVWAKDTLWKQSPRIANQTIQYSFRLCIDCIVWSHIASRKYITEVYGSNCAMNLAQIIPIRSAIQGIFRETSWRAWKHFAGETV